MNAISQNVFIIDDDEAVLDALSLLIKSLGLSVKTFSSAKAYLDVYDPDAAGCLVLDIRMPGMSGLELQQKLNEMHCIMPIIFITGHGDVPMAVQAMKEGAIEFIQKPFRDQDLIDKIYIALEQDSENRKQLHEKQATLDRIESLTPREKEVMERVIAGQANKVIAIDLNVSQRTVEIHRANVMQKMQARSLAQLVRMVMSTQQAE